MAKWLAELIIKFSKIIGNFISAGVIIILLYLGGFLSPYTHTQVFYVWIALGFFIDAITSTELEVKMAE